MRIFDARGVGRVPADPPRATPMHARSRCLGVYPLNRTYGYPLNRTYGFDLCVLARKKVDYMEFYSVLSRPPAQSHPLAAQAAHTTHSEWPDHAARPNHSACNDPIASVPLASPASPAAGTVMALAELRSEVPAPLAPEMRAHRALPSQPDSGLARLAREAAYERDALVLALHAKAFRHSFRQALRGCR
jgi:hypothetical protein